MNEHPLDRPIWYALNETQRAASVGDAHARRYTADIGPLGAAVDNSPEALTSLAALVPEEGRIVLLQTADAVVPPGIGCEPIAMGVQMVLDELLPGPIDARIEKLADSDAREMLALARETRPGPFESRTHTLGAFWGIKEHGRLVAMAGERVKLPGYVEISGVCTDPAFRGRGFAAHLTRHVASRILAHGDVPILHAYATNEAAIRVYQSLGFSIRSCFPVKVLRRSAGDA